MLSKITNRQGYSGDTITTIVFLHGNSMNASMFCKQLQSDLFKKYNFISIDLPGHGESDRIADYSIPQILNLLQDELKSFDSLVLVGHSLGGHLAIQLLPYLENRCNAVFLIGTPPMRLPLNVDTAYHLTEKSALFLQNEISQDQLKGLVDLIYQGEDNISTELINSMQDTDGKFREDFGASLVKGEIEDEVELLKKFGGSIALVVGTDDSLVNLEYVKALANEIPDCQFHFIPNSGHCPQLDNPKILNEILFDFIDKN